MNLKILIATLATAVAGFWLYSSNQTGNESPKKAPIEKVNIGVVQIIEHPALDQTRKGILDRLAEQGYVDGQNAHIQFESAQGNPALCAQIAQKFIGSNVRIIFAIGTTAAQAAQQVARDSATAIVFASVTDPQGAKLVNTMNEPGQNITGVSNYVAVSKQFAFFKKILPHLKNVGVVYNPGEQNSVNILDRMNEVDEIFNFKVVPSPAPKTSDVMSATQGLVGKAECVFINNDNTALSAIDAVIKVANENDMPVFVSDIDLLDKGALAALGADQYALGQQAADQGIRILKGESPQKMAVEFPNKVVARVNVAVSARLQIAHLNEKIEHFSS